MRIKELHRQIKELRDAIPRRPRRETSPTEAEPRYFSEDVPGMVQIGSGVLYDSYISTDPCPDGCLPKVYHRRPRSHFPGYT